MITPCCQISTAYRLVVSEYEVPEVLISQECILFFWNTLYIRVILQLLMLAFWLLCDVWPNKNEWIVEQGVSKMQDNINNIGPFDPRVLNHYRSGLASKCSLWGCKVFWGILRPRMTPPALFELKTTILGHSSPVWVFRRKKIRFDLKIVICGFFRSPSPIWPKMPPKNIFLPKQTTPLFLVLKTTILGP